MPCAGIYATIPAFPARSVHLEVPRVWPRWMLTGEVERMKIMAITEELMLKLVKASPSMMANINEILDGRMDVPPVVNVDISSMTFAEASRQSRISCPTLYRLANAGQIPTVKLGGSRRILRKGLIDFMYSGYRDLKGKRSAAVPAGVSR